MRIFLLSPANANGKRATYAAKRLADASLPLAEIFTLISGLYFRGKIAYAEAFADATYVITPHRGLLPPHHLITCADLTSFAATPVNPREPRYALPLIRTAADLAARNPDSEFVLLGSLATPKYTGPLLPVLGSRLLFPADFLGMGDMQRGALMLRSARENSQLNYARVCDMDCGKKAK